MYLVDRVTTILTLGIAADRDGEEEEDAMKNRTVQ